MGMLLELHIVGLLVATGVLVALSTGRRPMAAAAWAAPLVALIVTRSAPPAPALLGLFIAIFVGSTVSSRQLMPLATTAFLAQMAVSSAVSLLPFVADILLAGPLPSLVSTLVFPAAVVTIEYAGSQANPFGTWGASAYSQRRDLPLVQLAAVTGIWGISFLVNWAGSVIAWIIVVAPPPRAGLTVFGTLAGAVLLVHAFGAMRLRALRRPGHGTAVAIVSRPLELLRPDQLERLLIADLTDPVAASQASARFGAVVDQLLEETATAARLGADLVVWPEADAVTLRRDTARLLQRIRECAERLDVHILVGLLEIDQEADRRFDNQVVLVSPRGDVDLRYRKAKLVPGLEAAHARIGTEPVTVVDTALGRLSAAICFDLDFPAHIRAAGRGGADLLLVAASDWPAIGRVHADIAAVRAVENGTTVVRAARSGISEVVDPAGRTFARIDHQQRSGTALAATAPERGHVPTLYVRWGDWFAQLATTFVIVTAALAVIGSLS